METAKRPYQRLWGPFLEGLETFPHPESCIKILNLDTDWESALTTEIPFVQIVSAVNTSLFFF